MNGLSRNEALLTSRPGSHDLDLIPAALVQALHRTGNTLIARETMVTKEDSRLDSWYANLFEHGQTLRFYESLVAVYLLKHFRGRPIVEVGSGMGFFAVLMSMMDCDVYSIEENPDLASLQRSLLHDMLQHYPYRQAVVVKGISGTHLTFPPKPPRLVIINGSFPEIKAELPQEAILVFGNVPEVIPSSRRREVIAAASYFRYMLFDANQFYCYFPDHIEASIRDFRERGLHPERVSFLRYAHAKFFPSDFPLAYYLVDSHTHTTKPRYAKRLASDFVKAFGSLTGRRAQPTTRGEVVSIKDEGIVGWIEHSSKRRDSGLGVRLVSGDSELEGIDLQISYSANGLHNFVVRLPGAGFPIRFLREEVDVYATSPGLVDSKMTINPRSILELVHKVR